MNDALAISNALYLAQDGALVPDSMIVDAKAALDNLVEQLEARQKALDEVFRLIWIEDAPYVEGGSRKLDEWAERNQVLASRYEEPLGSSPVSRQDA